MRVLVTIMVMLCCMTVLRADLQSGEARAILESYCLDCHSGDTKEADVDLSTFAKPDSFLKDRRTWHRVIAMLESSVMPPEDSPQPTQAEREALIAWLDASLEAVDFEAVRAPGRVPVSRLPRAEFQYAAEDLFGVRVELDRILPADPEGLSGFANDHASLTMTAKQLTAQLKAAETIAAAVVDGALDSEFEIRYEVEDGTNASFEKSVAKHLDGSRGWDFTSRLSNKYQAVSQTFDFDRTGRYRIRMRARSTGPGDYAAAWIAVDTINDASEEVGFLIKGQDPAVYEAELFITKGRHTLIFGYDFYGPLWLPEPPDRAQLKLGQSTFDPPPYDRTGLIPRGVSVEDLNAEGFKIARDKQERVMELARTINDGYFVAVLDNLMLHKFHFEKGYLPIFLAGLSYEYQTNVVPAFIELANITNTDRSKLEKVWESRQPDAYKGLKRIAKQQREAWNKQEQSRKAEVGNMFVDWIEIEATSTKHPVPRDAKTVSAYLEKLLPRAVRRPVDDGVRDRFQSIYDGERAAGANHHDALQRMLIAVLVSPEFLFRTDGSVTASGVSRLDGHALASRLSSFLWCSVPDEELMRVASQDELASETQVDRQVERMLRDERRRRFSRLYTEQWLNLSDVGRGKEPDKELFRYFSWRLAEDMREEVALVFDRILRENRSVLELLDGEETYLNERLARLYGIEHVRGADFRLVKLADSRRGGLLGTAGVLTSTSLATRTSPVRRGQFVLETLLGVDLPSPPADVPELSDKAGQSRELSLRESLALHREHAKCAGCHDKIDPLGVALENYDWIGRWRDNDPAGPVDPSTRLSIGRELNGVGDLKTYLATERRDEFLTSLTRAMLMYALGRDLEYFDEAAVRGIVAVVKADEYRSQTLVKAIARSYPFRYREVKETHE